MTGRKIISCSVFALFLFLFWGSAASFASARENEKKEKEDIKKRAEWFQRSRRQGLNGNNPAALLLKARQQIKTMAKPKITSFITKLFAPAPAAVPLGNWVAVGPQPVLDGSIARVSGRGTAIAVDLVNDPNGNIVYYGAADGGVWKSTNAMSASPTFLPMTDQTETLAMGAIALDSSAGQSIVYAGTGEANNNGDSFYGVGVLKSTDGGKTWALTSTANGGSLSFAGVSFSKILVDPVNPKLLIASTVPGSFGGEPLTADPKSLNPLQVNSGIYYSTDGGNSWTQVSGPLANQTVTDLAYDPSGGGTNVATYYAAVWGMGFYKSTDGMHWSAMSSPFSSGVVLGSANFQRANMAVRNGVLYAVIETGGYISQPSGKDTGLVQSTDNGASWTAIAVPDLYWALYYNLVIAAPPGTNNLVLGGVYLYTSGPVNGMNTSWYESGEDDNPPYVNLHADQHALAMVDSTHWFECNDGGLFFTADSGSSWSERNDTLNTLQFYSVSPDSKTAGTFLGGSQDNGREFTTGSPSWSLTTDFPVGDGDGLFTVADPVNTGQFYAEFPSAGVIGEFTNGVQEYSVVDSSTINDSAGWYEFELLSQNGPTSLVAAPNDVWIGPALTTSPGQGWHSISPKFNNVSYVGPAPSDPNVIYVTAGSNIQVTTNALSASPAWTQLTPFNDGYTLGHIAVNPTNPNIVYVIKEGFVDGQKIYMSTNAESANPTWTNISGSGSTGLPNVPMTWITLDPQYPNNIYVASDTGVFLATDGGIAGAGENWQVVGAGLPNTTVLQVKISNSYPRQLVAATHGRGAWTLNIPGNTLPTSTPTNTGTSTATSTATKTATATATNTATCTATMTSIIACPGGGMTGATISPGANNPILNLNYANTYVVLVHFASPALIKAIQVYGAGTGAQQRVGVYDDNGQGAPGALLASASYIDGPAEAAQVIPLSVEITPGAKWLAISSAQTRGRSSHNPVFNNYTETSLVNITGGIGGMEFAGQMPAAAAAASNVTTLPIAAFYCPVCEPTGRSWSPNTNWYIGGPREFMGTTVYNSLMWTLGGRSPLGDSGDCDFSSDGMNWYSATPFGPMGGREGQVLLTFDPGDGRGERLFAIGGLRYPGNTFTGPPTNTYNDVWSSFDGGNWSQVTGNGGFPAGAPYVGAVFNNKMWLIGGGTKPNMPNQVWSSTDGATWTPGSTITGPETAQTALVYDGQLFVIENGDRQFTGVGNLIFSSVDGTSWTEVGGLPTKNFGNRNGFSAQAAWGKLWVFGGNLLGATAAQDKLMNDVWNSTDGAKWTQVTGSANFPIRQNAGSYNYNGQLWVLGGMTNPVNTPSNGFGYTGDVWSTYCSEGPVTVRGGISGGLLGNIVNQVGRLMDLSFNLSNIGADPLNLSEVEVRYWFNSNCGTPDIRAWVQGRGGDTGRRDNNNGGLIQTSVGSLTPGSSIQYLSFKFNDANLPVGNQITIGAIAFFGQNPAANCALSALPPGNQLTIYENGTLVQGQEPTGSPATPTVSPTYSATYTPTISPTQSPTLSPTATLTKTVTPSPTVLWVATPTPTCPFGTNISFVPCGPTSTPTTQTVLAALVVSHPATATPTLTPTQTAASTAGGGLVLSAVMEPRAIHGGKPVRLLLTLAGPASVQWTITSSAGEKIYQTTILGQTGLNTLAWSGLNQAGLPVGDGVYTYVIQAQEGLNQTVTQGKIFVRR